MKIHEKIVDETNKLKIIRIACDSFAKNIYHFFYWWKMNFYNNNFNNAFLTFLNCSWKYIDRNIFFIVFEIVLQVSQHKIM